MRPPSQTRVLRAYLRSVPTVSGRSPGSKSPKHLSDARSVPTLAVFHPPVNLGSEPALGRCFTVAASIPQVKPGFWEPFPFHVSQRYLPAVVPVNSCEFLGSVAGCCDMLNISKRFITAEARDGNRTVTVTGLLWVLGWRQNVAVAGGNGSKCRVTLSNE